MNDDILQWAAEMGYKHIRWSRKCDALDWVADTISNLYRTDAEILRHFLDIEEKEGLSGRIILMHLGTDRKSEYAYDILPELITTLRSRGYKFKKISELIKRSGNPSDLSSTP